MRNLLRINPYYYAILPATLSQLASTLGLLLLMTTYLAPFAIIQSQMDSPRPRESPTSQYVLSALKIGLVSSRLMRAYTIGAACQSSTARGLWSAESVSLFSGLSCAAAVKALVLTVLTETSIDILKSSCACFKARWRVSPTIAYATSVTER